MSIKDGMGPPKDYKFYTERHSNSFRVSMLLESADQLGYIEHCLETGYKRMSDVDEYTYLFLRDLVESFLEDCLEL